MFQSEMMEGGIREKLYPGFQLPQFPEMETGHSISSLGPNVAHTPRVTPGCF